MNTILPISFGTFLLCTFFLSTVFARDTSPNTYSAPTLRESGKVIARSGDVIQGLRISNPSGPCVVAQNVTNVTIVNNEIGPCGSDPHYQIGVYVNQASDLQILNNRFQDVSSALYAVNDTRGKLLFEGNYATRIRGPMPRGQLVQLNQYSGPNITIRCNISDQAIGGYTNSDGKGGPEDHINIYKSSGTQDSSIYIVNNKIRGGGSKSGGGILAVDNGGGSYVHIDQNLLVDPGQYGIGIASGSNIKVTNNVIYSSAHDWTNVGIYIWNQYPSTNCANNEVSGNFAKKE
jgi:Right handed beta helix region